MGIVAVGPEIVVTGLEVGTRVVTGDEVAPVGAAALVVSEATPEVGPAEVGAAEVAGAVAALEAGAWVC